MRKTTIVVAIAAVAVAALAGSAGARSKDTTLTGAGSTFVAPLVDAWTPALGSAYGYTVNYNPIGSGGGIQAISSRQVDFGASDAPMSASQFQGCNGCEQIPWALSATSVIYNLNGVKGLLHIDGPTLAKIFLGQITKWNDPALQKLNKGVKLPDETIATVHRADSSGTTFNFTDYLSSVSPAWKSKVGNDTSVNWPNGTSGKGSSGVAANVAQTPGSIGYVDVAYALKNHLSYFAVENKSGKFTTPGIRGILAAASSDQKPAADNSLSIVNPPKKYADAYPISTFTYVILPLKTSMAPELKKMVFWALTKGQSFGPKLLFAPLPKSVLVVDERAIKRVHS
ncbi:MAG: phosphate ABC transporter substrate-binding protein PstS [Actinobacteria bacterium]|nr:phosphate ABC transporter substrate-binding protein PstS [Actinomycetota bacterium]